ncbi:zinc-ribbon domain-containing protein [Halobacillus litoralis]|uniref:zinc-ribbon domain-containing protein n=1 Tax=Halobacillus litoralis TaxID=45668 RepID=UPI003990433F
MPDFCTNCGMKLKADTHFCENCGQKFSSSIPPASDLPKENQSKRKKSVLFVCLAGFLLIFIAGYYSWDHLRAKTLDPEVSVKPETGSVLEVEEERNEDAPPASQESEAEHTSEPETKDKSVENKEDPLVRYEEKLNNLADVHPFGLGTWTLNKNAQEIELSIENPDSNGIFTLYQLYDTGEYDVLRAWAQEVFYIAQEIEESTGSKTSISISTTCDHQVPETMFPSDMLSYSGSCGYSLPILYGDTKENLTLLLHTKVFREEEELLSRSFHVPSIVDSIKAEYSHINESQNLYTQETAAPDVTEYINENQVRRKLVEQKLDGSTIESFYTDNGELFFIYTMEDGMENRYYFSDGLLVRWIDPSGKTIDAGNETEEYLKYNHYWQEQRSKWKNNEFY